MATNARIIHAPHALPQASGGSGGEAETGKRKGIADGREYVVRGVLRYTNSLLTYFLVLSMLANIWLAYAWRANARELSAEVRKQWLVFSVAPDGKTTVHNASEYQTGPSDLQVDSRSWDTASLIATAGSKNVDANFADAQKFMTARFRSEFNDTLGTERDEIKRLNIYQEFEGEVRQAQPEDFAQMPVQPDLTRFGRIVSGRLSTYGIDTRERVLTRNVAYHVRLVPLPEPTRENPLGLLVDRLIPVKLPVTNTEVQKDVSQAPTSTPAAK